MDFEWDSAKAQSNLTKHGVSFELAIRVWDDPLHVILFDRVSNGEERWHAIGTIGGIVVLVVVHSYRGNGIIRIIGAQKATAQERRRYEEEIL